MKCRSATQNASPDMTPMLDIVFILIIFFVVTASFVQERGIGLDRPQGTPRTPPPSQEGLLLQLTQEHRILYQGHVVDVWAATALMQQFHVEHDDQVIVLKLEPGAKLGQLVNLLDHGRMAGLPRGSIAVL